MIKKCISERYGLVLLFVLSVVLAACGGEDEDTQTSTDGGAQTSTESAREIAEQGVESNAAWTPYSEEFNGVEMMLVPAGCFMMGSEERDREKPVHEQCFDEPFWIDKYEVTNEQYGSTGCERTSSEPDQPRNCVDWFEARDYCDSRGARLPTEREWEYAARGPDNLIYPWGNEFDGDKVIYEDSPEYGDTKTAPVGSRPAGASWVGALDMSGNVWEWVSSLYGDYPYSPGEHESNSDTNSGRVLRGGSFDDTLGLRAALRFGNSPGGESSYGGFRCARSY